MTRLQFLGVTLIVAFSFASFVRCSDIPDGVYQLQFRYVYGGASNLYLNEGPPGFQDNARDAVARVSPEGWIVVNNADGTVTLQSKSSGNYLDIGELVIGKRAATSIKTVPRNSQSQARSWSLVPSVLPEDAGRYYIEMYPEPYYQFQHPIVAASRYQPSFSIMGRVDHRSDSFEFVSANN
ncbi:hypothetical protein EDD11_009036 [Mortierella claussenii]|nr:hypothetical protein EDD11_009036 [Mortierella claussenii]